MKLTITWKAKLLTAIAAVLLILVFQPGHSAYAEEESLSGSGYVLMNIPYSDFYEQEAVNYSSDITGPDAVTSATKQKTRSGSLAAGSYHENEDGSDITGIIYPVKVDDLSILDPEKRVTDDRSVSITTTLRGQTTTTEYKGRDSLFQAPSYSYYVLPDGETPACYKNLTKNILFGNFEFSKVVGSQETLNSASAEITADARHSDYQINVSGLPESLQTVSGIVLTAEDESGFVNYNYGMRHIKNIWLVSEIGLNTGESDYCRSIVGKTITKITYYTQDKIYTINTNLKVKEKTGITLTGTEGMIDSSGSGTASFSLSDSLPSGFDPVYSVDGLKSGQSASFSGNQVTVTGAIPGTYTILIHDSSDQYADIKGTFVLKTDQMPAKYDADGKKLIRSDEAGVTDEDFENYLNNISKVTVNGTDYSTGNHGLTIVKNDGTIDLAVTSGEENVFKDGDNTVTVVSTGYPDLSFTLKIDSTTPVDPGTQPERYTVTFDSNGGSAVSPITVESGKTLTAPTEPTRDGYDFLGWAVERDGSEMYDFSKAVTSDMTLYAVWKKEEEKDSDESDASETETAKTVINLKALPKSKTSEKLTWTKVRGASGYDVYSSRCGRKLKKVRSTKKLTLIKKNLKKGKVYKYKVRAYKKVKGRKSYIASAYVAHAIAGGYNKKYTDAKSIRAAKKSVTLKTGKTVRIKASQMKRKKNRKFLRSSHAALFRYKSSDPSVAIVSKSGKVTAKKAGTCRIWIYAQNGLEAATTVVVK